MLTTTLHQLDTRDTSWFVAHLFEHLVIDGFYKYLEQESIDSRLFGWIEADTFEDRIFLSAGFYNPKAAKLLNQYLNNLPGYPQKDITRATETIQVEDKVLINIAEPSHLVSEIKRLSNRKWNLDLSTPAIASKNIKLVEKRAAKNYRDITVLIGADNLSLVDKKLLLRLRTIMIDIITHKIREALPAYHRGSSDVITQQDSAAFMVKYTIPKTSAKLSDVELLAKRAIGEFNIKQHKKELKRHFKVFAQEPTWQSLPVEYYRNTGISTTNKEIAALATPKNIDRLLKRIIIKVRSSTKDDERHIY